MEGCNTKGSIDENEDEPNGIGKSRVYGWDQKRKKVYEYEEIIFVTETITGPSSFGLRNKEGGP